MTLAPVRLHRDPVIIGSPVEELPPWIPPLDAGTYWHQPRSANRRDDGILIVHAWCGPTLYRDEALLAAVDVPPAEFRCGTCLGRRLGYDRRDGAIFRPRDPWALPAYCPGRSGADDACFACGARVRWYATGYQTTESRHRPEPELAARCVPCPRHGWREMRARDGKLICGSFGCDHGGGPR